MAKLGPKVVFLFIWQKQISWAQLLKVPGHNASGSPRGQGYGTRVGRGARTPLLPAPDPPPALQTAA